MVTHNLRLKLALASLAREGECGSFSGKARKMNHLSSLCASEARAKSYFNTFEIFTCRCEKW
ncbi:MAG: hypothetical protein U5L45_21280 [Saprospiraceae bacterium]|nr:hypothetical protein [Saprospiraceae bacterium]